MKNRIVVLLLVPLLLSGCSDFLTKNDPTATTDEDFWTTLGEVKGSLDYIYSGLPSGTYQFYANDRTALSGLTDNAFWANNFYGSINAFAQGNATSTSFGPDGRSVLNIWAYNYDRIRQAARFVKYADRAEVREELKQRMIAEARALLAWYHLELFLYWKHIPIIRYPVKATEMRSISNNMTSDEIVKFITAQLDSAAAHLPYSYPDNEEWRMTKGACYAMKAITYLNNKMYKKAAKAANKVIHLRNKKGKKVYHLYHSSDGKDSYKELFRYKGETNDEGILIQNGGLGTIWFRTGPAGMYPGPYQTGLAVTASLVNAYETKQGKTLDMMTGDSSQIYRAHPNYHSNRDPRMDATILYPNEEWGGYTYDPFNDDVENADRIGASTASPTGFVYQKYLDLEDRGSPMGTSLDFMIIRYAQILLIRVEALVEMGKWQHPDVVKYLNMIRNRAGMPDVNLSVYNTQNEIRQLYRRERRVELAMEGWRWFDIRRWGIADKVMKGKVYGAVDPETGEPIQVGVRDFGPEDKLLPIPLNEVESSNIKQNPGY